MLLHVISGLKIPNGKQVYLKMLTWANEPSTWKSSWLGRERGALLTAGSKEASRVAVLKISDFDLVFFLI